MEAAFDPGKADFSGIAPELYVSAALQKTFVEVNEEGVEAAAATGMAPLTVGLPHPKPEPFKMIVDRPFMLLIEDDGTGTILFMGVMFDPQAG
jgi:serpin B